MKNLFSKFKCLLFFLVFCIFLSNLCYIKEVKAVEFLPGEYLVGKIGSDGFEYATKDTKFFEPIPYEKHNLLLNLTLYKEKQIIVYGSYKNVNNNDFKYATNPKHRNDNLEDVKNDGYYIEESTKRRGEYRYHGISSEGGSYENAEFPVDVGMRYNPDQYKYIYRRWEKGSKYYDETKTGYINEVATGNYNVNSYIKTAAQKIVSNILKDSGFNSTGTVPNNIGGNGSIYAYDYANVLCVPSKFSIGQVSMAHMTSSGKKYYVDFISHAIPYTKEKLDMDLDVEFNGAIDLNQLQYGKDIKLNLRATSAILDEGYYNNKYLKDLYYTRYDVDHWRLKLTNKIDKKYDQEIEISREDAENGGAKVTYDFTVTVPYEWIKNKVDKGNKQVYGSIIEYSIKLKDILHIRAEAHYYSGEQSFIESDDDLSGEIGYPIEEKIIPKVIENGIKINIDAPKEMLDTERFKLVNNTDEKSRENTVSTEVYLDGDLLSREDAEAFLNGQYLFPLKGQDDIYNYAIFMKNSEGTVFFHKSYVKVYQTRPYGRIIIDGIQKENRAMTAKSIIKKRYLSSQYLLDRSDIYVESFDIMDKEKRKDIKINSQNFEDIQFLCKKPNTDINLELDIRADIDPEYIERNDIPSWYHTGHNTYELMVIPDFKPAVVANIWNFVLTRNEELNYMTDIVSTDGDKITKQTYAIYYDKNKDDIPETLIQSGQIEDLKGYKPNELGTYKLVIYAEEEFGQETYEKFITEEDKRTETIEKMFYVENLAPSTQLYTDIPIEYPKVDVMWLNDQDISRDLNNDIKSSKVNFLNNLIRKSLNPNVEIWDTHTYTYYQDAADYKKTGTSYPSQTIEYESGGYKGTLKLKKDGVKNSPYYGIVGVDSITVTDSFPADNQEKIYYNSSGDVTHTKNPQLENTKYKDGREYTKGKGQKVKDYGSGVGTGKDANGNDTSYVSERTIDWTVEYTATWEEVIEVYGYIDDYTGYYEGIISKDEKQEYKQSYSDTSSKYIVYFANDKLYNLDDLQTAIERADSKIIVVGNETVKNDDRIKKDLFIYNDKELEEIQSEIIDYISKDNPMERSLAVLINEDFSIDYSDFDMENDKINPIGLQIVHEKDYFNNSMGQESRTLTKFDENKYKTNITLPTKFTKSGSYNIYRKVKDLPTGYINKSEYSNDATIQILAHRKPIAKCSLDWKFEETKGYYNTTWQDESYDPDLQYKDPLGKKGIRETKIKYRNVVNPAWTFAIPDKLYPGTYELEYIVKDNFGVWSDPYNFQFTLKDLPPIQIDAELRTQLPEFSLKSVPASENLVAYNIHTRYPFEVQLKLALYKNGSPVTPIKTVKYSPSTALKSEQDIYWNDVVTNIPATLKSGDYVFKVRALETIRATRYTDKDFNVHVQTPINLKPINVPEKVIYPGSVNTFLLQAKTSKYVNSSYKGSGVTVTVYSGTAYQKTYTMYKKSGVWVANPSKQKGIPDGYYTAQFVATLPSGETEIKNVQFMHINNTPPVINDSIIKTSINDPYIYENDDVNFELKFHDRELTDLTIDVNLFYKYNNNSLRLVKSYKSDVSPKGAAYDAYNIRLIDDIPLGNYILIATVIDDQNEKATITKEFTAHDLWVTGKVDHTDQWNINRQKYNDKYPSKKRSDNTYWNGEKLMTNADTTVIHSQSKVTCKKVSIEILNNDKPADNKYLQWMYASNSAKNKWYLAYFDKLWTQNKDGRLVIRWGSEKAQKLKVKFTAHYSNDWIEYSYVDIIIDHREPFWELHRSW